MDIWIASIFWSLWIRQQWTREHRPLLEATVTSGSRLNDILVVVFVYRRLCCSHTSSIFDFWGTIMMFSIVKVLVAQSCPTLCNYMVCSLPGSSVHGILQARKRKWVAISFSVFHSNCTNCVPITRAGGFLFSASGPLPFSLFPFSSPNSCEVTARGFGLHFPDD